MSRKSNIKIRPVHPTEVIQLQSFARRCFVAAFAHLNTKACTQLLTYLINLAQAEGFEHIWLGVWEENTAAIRFYERHGFSVFSKHDFHLGNDLQTDLMMKRSLA